MNKLLFQLAFLIGIQGSFSQEIVERDSLQNNSKKWEVSIDFASRYIWRGQSWGGNYFVIQPTFTYALNDKFSIGTWATSNFLHNNYERDGTTSKGYQELDFFISYSFSDCFSIELWDYYWPTVEKIEGVDNSFFNYGANGVKSLDLILIADFQENRIPFKILFSTLISGNDFRVDDNGRLKRNFTSYAELSYFKQFFDRIECSGTIGAVFNNKAQYYTYADYDKFSLCNFNLKSLYVLNKGHKIEFPIWLSYTYNAATFNTEIFGRNLVVLGMTVSF